MTDKQIRDLMIVGLFFPTVKLLIDLIQLILE